MSSGFSVTSEELTHKAEAIGQVSDSIRECVAAIGTEGVGGLVYGVLFDPTVLPLLSEMGQCMSTTIGTVADAAATISTNLTKNSQTYDSVETFLTSHFGSMPTDPGSPG